MTKYVIGYVILAGPVEFPEHIRAYPGVEESILAYAVEIDMISPSQSICSIRGGRALYEVLKDAPHSSLATPFMVYDRQVVRQYLDFSRAYRDYCQQQMLLNSATAAYWENAVQETDKLYKIWDLVDDLCIKESSHSTRKLKLKELYALLGEDYFYSGTLPPFVPTWRFRSID